MRTTPVLLLTLGLSLLGCGSEPGSSSDCVDPDGDGYGTGTTCDGTDCSEADSTCWEGTCCDAVDCTDTDGDGYGTGADCLGPDCSEADNTCWEGTCCDAVDCTDADGDGYGDGADCQGADCDDTDDTCWAGGCCQVTAECTHYVDSQSSSDDWVAAQDMATPTTPQAAVANAQAGDVVCFRSGTYNVGGPTSAYNNTLQPANSGTPGNRIIFMAYPGELPIINGDSGGGDGSTPFGVKGQAYITLDGFKLTVDNGVKAARSYIGNDADSYYSGWDTYSTHDIELLNMEYDGGTTQVDTNDNRDGIRLDRVRGVLIKNSYLHNYWSGTNEFLNVSAIKSYGGHDITVENCEFRHNSGSVYMKSFNRGWTIRHNFFSGNYWNITGGTSTHYVTDVEVYNNVVYDGKKGGINIGCSDDPGDNEFAPVNNIHIWNNTVWNFDTTTALSAIAAVYSGTLRDGMSASGFRFYNNLAYGNGTDYSGYQIAHDTDITADVIDYNLYDGASFNVLQFTGGGTFFSLTDLQAATLCHLAPGNHNQNSVVGTPVFTNANGDYSEPSDFQLAPGSPGTNAGDDGNDIGADVSLVGIGANN